MAFFRAPRYPLNRRELPTAELEIPAARPQAR